MVYYYAVLKLSIYYRYYLKVSIILGLHKVRTMRGTQNLRITHQYSSEPCIFRRNVSIRSNIFVPVYVILYIILNAENNVFCRVLSARACVYFRKVVSTVEGKNWVSFY